MLEDTADVHVESGFALDREDLFRTLLTVTSDPVCALDADRRIVAADDEMIALTGYDRERLLGSPATLLFGDDDLEALEMMVAKVDRQGDSIDSEFDLLTADGKVRRCELRVALPDAAEGPVVAAVRDVTGLRRREERIEVLDRVLRHNIRNKIGTVLGYLDTLMEDADAEETVRRARIAKNEADELRALSDKARRFHKLLELDPVRSTVEDLQPVFEEVVGKYRERYPDAEFDPVLADHPPTFVDQELIEAALTEVVGNALQHSDRETPRIEASVDVTDDRVNLEIADDGPGIPAEERAAIMEGNERPLYHASGLGIWFVKWCLHLSGGQLLIEPNDPRGTVVVLSLPRADSIPAA